MDVAVLVPAHNEAVAIEKTVAAALSVPGVTRVVVVDDGSTDDTDHLAEKAGAKVVRLFGTHGKGTALEAGAMRVENADVIVLLDGDLGDTATQADLLIRPVVAGEADMTIATFPKPTGKAGFGLVKGLARWGIGVLGGRGDLAAPLSGQRALTRECFEDVRPFTAGYGAEVGITIRALRADRRVLEVPTTMAHAATGRNVAGFVHRGRQFVHVALALARLAFERSRKRP